VEVNIIIKVLNALTKNVEQLAHDVTYIDYDKSKLDGLQEIPTEHDTFNRILVLQHVVRKMFVMLNSPFESSNKYLCDVLLHFGDIENFKGSTDS
jgi:hypothetical protein